MTHSPDRFIYTPPEAGILRIGGRDRVDFLQRQSTNDINLLNVAGTLSTVLTTPAARIIDLLQIIHEDEDHFLAVTLPHRGPSTRDFLRSRVFFMDQVTIDDVQQDFAVFRVNGPDVREQFETLGLPFTSPERCAQAKYEGHDLWITGTTWPGGAGVQVLSSRTGCDRLLERLRGSGIVDLSQAEYDRLRIEAGQPGYQGELVDAFTPLEVGLQDLISETKGCYTGQEVIARQITYDKVTRHLVGITLSAVVQPGMKVKVNGSSAGVLTSSVESPSFGPIALGVLKNPHNQPGTVVEVDNDDQGEVRGTVVPLPFQSESRE